jgi:hypothetical protein
MKALFMIRRGAFLLPILMKNAKYSPFVLIVQGEHKTGKNGDIS